MRKDYRQGFSKGTHVTKDGRTVKKGGLVKKGRPRLTKKGWK